jgi:hypothetical protein
MLGCLLSDQVSVQLVTFLVGCLIIRLICFLFSRLCALLCAHLAAYVLGGFLVISCFNGHCFVILLFICVLRLFTWLQPRYRVRYSHWATDWPTEVSCSVQSLGYRLADWGIMFGTVTGLQIGRLRYHFRCSHWAIDWPTEVSSFDIR